MSVIITVLSPLALQWYYSIAILLHHMIDLLKSYKKSSRMVDLRPRVSELQPEVAGQCENMQTGSHQGETVRRKTIMHHGMVLEIRRQCGRVVRTLD